MPKILVTGASGFVGSWLIKEARTRDLDVYAGIRSSSSKDLLQGVSVHYSIIDFDDTSGLEDLLEQEQYDYIIHNAGVTRAQDNHTYQRVNVDYSVKLATIANEKIGARLKKFVYISSIEAYGSADHTSGGVVDHNCTPAPRTTYGRSKLKAEKKLTDIQGLPLIILRPTAVFGPGERDLFAFWQTIKKYKITPIVGNQHIKYTFIYVKDLARVVLDACLSPITDKSYFISDGRIHKMKDYLSHIASSLGVRTISFTVPYTLLDIATKVTGIYDKVSGTKSLLNEEQMAKAKAQNWDCDISDLVQDFDFQPDYTLQAAVEETTQWYLDKGWL